MDWKYIAGFFDGEGTITKAEKRYRIYITQTNFAVLDGIQKFSGVGTVKKIKKRKQHWQDAWVYYISDKYKIKFFLEKSIPHLIVKKQIAHNAINVIDVKIANDKKRVKIKQDRIIQINKMRDQGLSYRDIGKQLNIDWGYTRKLIKGEK